MVEKSTLKSSIKGLDKLVQDDIPQNSMILVTGTPGTLKSSFTFALMANYLKGSSESGFYLTLEQSTESFLRNMESIGLKMPENLEIGDFSGIRKKYREMENKLDIAKITEEIIRFYKRKEGEKFSFFALDSLNAFYSFAITPTRGEFYHFFNMLRESKLTSFVIFETQAFSSLSMYGPEYFLADGIIELGALEKPDEVVRYLQIRKMRETAYVMKKHRMSTENKTITVLGSVYE